MGNQCRLASAFTAFLAIVVSIVVLNRDGFADERFITLASTTSTANSGLFDAVLPQFSDQAGIDVQVVAVGTGQAINIAKPGDADVLLVHHTPSEQAFVDEGFGVERFDVMYNDFVLVGPDADPAGIRGLPDVSQALSKIAAQATPFVSRGDDSGTHKAGFSTRACATCGERQPQD
jgi:tungstate transport system substrate-binding protein